MRRHLILALILVLGMAPGAIAQQVSAGNVYGLVLDESGSVLPGAAVTLTSELGRRSSTTDSRGEFRFLNLDRGRYKVTVALGGFTTVSREFTVVTGENANITFNLKVATVEESVTVTAEAPLVDIKRRGTSTTMTTEELSNVPNARDPWGVLKAVPGVLVDRVNIAGNENGQQANFGGKGATRSDANFNLDGLVITDMSATGASPTYYDFEAFNEIAVSTGGNDLQVQSGGIAINMVTKRGTNKFHGGARYLISDKDISFGNVPDALANDPRLLDADGTRRDKADHINRIEDYGFDFGGPILKDRLWFYFTWGKQDIKLIRLIGTPDDTILSSYNAKLNWQASSNTMVSAFWFLGSKQKFGREAGYPIQKSDSFNWNQDNAFEDKVGGPDRPAGLWKLQVDHTFSPSFFMTANGAYYNTGFTLAPRGGLGQSFTLDYVNNIALGSNIDYTAVRPQWHFNVNGNYFFGGLGGNHELKFGFGYRDYTTTSITAYGGNQLAGVIRNSGSVAWVARDGVVKYGGKYRNAYIGDVFSKDRFTANVGLRWDGQSARNLATEARANASLPNLVPALSYDGADEDAISWSDISPRVGVSYALDESRKTVLRGSYAYYADQLSFGNVTDENPVAYGFLAYSWNDANGDRIVQPGEVNLGNFLYNVNIDPANPGAVGSTVNKIDRDLKPKKDHELVFGVDHELAANWAVGLAYTWRRAVDNEYTPRLAGDCVGEPTVANCPLLKVTDYTANAPVTRNGYTALTYSPNPALVTAGGGGRLRTNAPGYHRTFNGIELTMTKRLSNRWMGRLAFSFNDWTEHWDGTPYSVGSDDGSPGRTEFDPLVDGGQVTLLSGGSGKASFYSNVKWQVYANALVQLPWNVDLSTAVFGRQGGAYPVSIQLSAGRDGTNRALATENIDSLRYDHLWNVDLRLAKTFRFREASLALTAEWFNVLNNDVVLSRFRFADSASFTNTARGAVPGRGSIEEIIAPSTFRLGARLTF